MKRTCAFLSVFALSAPLSYALDVDPQLQEARMALQNRDIAAATTVFRSVLEESASPAPTVERARFGLAVVELLQVYEQPAARAVLDRWGFSREGRDLFDWTSRSEVFETGEGVPDHANLEEVSSVFSEVIIPALDRFLELTEGITDTFSFSFDPQVYGWSGADETVVVDFTDVVLLRAAAHLVRGLSRLAITSNDWDLPAEVITDLLEEDMDPAELLDLYPGLGALLDGEERTQAGLDFFAAIDGYLSQSLALINPERENALFFVDADGEAGAGEFRDALGQLRAALEEPTEVNPGGIDAEVLDLSVLFSSWSLPQILTGFDGGSVLIDASTDPTFGGLFPAFGIVRYAEVLSDLGVDWVTTDWMSALPLGDDWFYLFWYGLWREFSGNWIYHMEHGVLYLDRSENTDWGFFAYDVGLGDWSWTSPWIFPWTYYFGGLSQWVYHARGSTPGNRWIFLDDEGLWVNEAERFGP
ncbi:MAG: hypothetical protein JJT96_05505 [Opitutales bacterium]|nr:hypothetical protein [Opitutales bacterium]